MNYKRKLFFLMLSLLVSCKAYDSTKQTFKNTSRGSGIANSFALKQELAPPVGIQSIQLHPAGKRAAPPIIRLHHPGQLKLEFDKIGPGSHQFTFTISHRDKNWQKSSISPNRYIDGFFTTHFASNKKSFAQNPTYHHYSYRFPNQQMKITESGNYLLTISDFKTNDVLFRLPFFVTENKGKISTRIQTLFAQRRDGRTLAQPFSIYQFPQFVNQPQFDLSFIYVQNRFWGRYRDTDFFDTATPGEVHFHLNRKQSFIGDYEFYVLDVRSFKPDGRRIVDFQPGKTPPIVTLYRDIQQFNQTPERFAGAVLGFPRNNRRAEYGKLIFTLETVKSINTNDDIYLVGDFNHWIINPRFRMRYNAIKKQWKGRALIKQGIYAYKYVIVAKNSINDLAIDRKFTNGKQEYLTFVYFRDPRLHFDRLLKVDRTVAR